MIGYLYIAATLVFGTYSQMIVKWRVGEAGDFPAGAGDKLHFLATFIFSPWVLSAGVAVLIAALAWVAALTQLELSRAYPFVGLTFATVLIGSAVFFSEAITIGKVAGVVLIIAGIAVSTLR
jgi:multidrug transporter EmrE-like cation transporter